LDKGFLVGAWELRIKPLQSAAITILDKKESTYSSISRLKEFISCPQAVKS
jgi:hypothetical protein